MCGRFTLKTPPGAIAKRFLVEMAKELRDGVVPRYNIAPSEGVLAVWDDRDAGRRKADFLHWGLVPRWAKDVGIGYRTINARCETAAEKPSFRDAMRYRRCLLPADGFYEWERRGKAKNPHYFQVGEGELFAMAGLWEYWQSPDGSEIYSCTVLTTRANAVLAGIHDRMPVILDPANYERWLDPANPKRESLADLLRPYPAERMRTYPVSNAVNAAGGGGSELIEPAPESTAGAEMDFFDKLFPEGDSPVAE